MSTTSTARIRTSRFADTVGVLAVVTGLLLGLVPGIANATHTAFDDGADQFEIDGDISGHLDWGYFAGDPENGELTPDGTGNADASFFKASLTEASYPNWEFVTGANAPKADLERLFVASQLAPEGSFIWLGATRVSDNGNVQVTVEFNNNELTLAGMEGAYREVGDFFIRFNFPGSSGADVDVYVSQWTGSAWGPEEQLDANTDFRDAVGTLGSDSREFVELEINLAGLFGGGGPLACGSFGSVSFRTEASGGNNDNNDPTLKDIAGPFAIDLDTCATVSVEKHDEEGNALSGAGFTLYPGADTSGTPVSGTGITNPCTTGSDGTCSFGTVQPGQYTIDETTVPPGYTKDADLPDTFTVSQNVPVTRTYDDPRIPYTITVEPDATNALDQNDAAASEHEFTVTLSDGVGGLADQTVDLAWTGAGEIVRINGVNGSGTSCTTDADGECLVVVNTSDPGGGTLTASWDTPYQNTVSSPTELPSTTATGGTPPTTAYPTIADSADKDWVGLGASIGDNGLNLLGDPHTFTVYVWEVDGDGADDGTEAGSEVAGATVNVSWSGPTGSTIDGNADSSSCVTGNDGTCTVVVDSDSNGGTGTATVTSVSGTVTGGETAVTNFEAGERTATKTWREYRASIDDDSTNPAGQSHTFTVTVEYSDDNGTTWNNPGAGLTVDWDGPTNGDNDLTSSTCHVGTNSDGECTIVVFNDAPGVGTITVTAVDGDLLLDGGESADGPFDVPDVDATKTWLAFTVDVSDPAVNQVGESHTFRVEVNFSDGGDYEPVAAGTKVAWTDSDDSRVDDDTCSSGTGDDPDTGATETNVCYITVNSSSPGTFSISVTGVDDFQFTGRTEDVDFSTAGETSKTWIAYRASIEADGTNLVGQDHTFTVTAEQDAGDGWGNVPDGTKVTVSTSGAVGSITSNECATAGTTNGTCEVVVNSDDPGQLIVSVETVEALDAVDSASDTADVSEGTGLDQDQGASASKTWIAYRADIQASATNLTGQQHVFTVTAEQNDGNGWTDVPDGTTVGYSTDNDSTVIDDTCDSTASGECTITVDSSSVDEVTVTIGSVSADDVDGDPDATVANTALSATTTGSLAATKTWIEVVVDVEADETNVVGENHTFTVDVDVITPSGTDEPDSGTLVASTSGVGSEVDQSCDDGLDAEGKCTVEVTSDAPGDRVVTAETLTFTYDGTTFTDVDLDGAVGIAGSTDLTATKTWRDYRVDIEADGLNLVRDEHTFTVTIEQTDDGDTWTDVPDGTTATVGIAGSAGSITGGTCETTGTVGGDCTVVVNSTTAGTGTVTVSVISVDLPEEDRTDISVDVTNDSAAKTWVAFRGLISADSLNVTGDSHDFTLTGQYTTNGSTWVDVPDDSSIGFSASGVGSTSGDTCDSTVGGDCTATVTSDDSGQRVVTVESIQATLTINDVTESFDVTLEDEASGVLDGADLPVAATKTWASYALELTPAEAVNLLDGTAEDPERFHTITAILTSDDATNAPVGGQTIDVTISGETGIITDVESGSVAPDGLSAECITATDGTCDIEIFSSVTGDATLSGSFTTAIGDSDPVTFDGNDATKTWTTFRVTVTPTQATNLVGNPHTFTVLVEQSNSDGSWVPVIGAVPSITLDADTATITGNTCPAGTVADDVLTLGIDEAGTCLVTVASDNVEAVTLTAEYEASVGQTTAAFSDRGDKTWIDFGIDVTPDTAENLVGTDHVFTVTVTTTFPVEGGTSTVPVVGGSVAVQLDGLGAITDNGCAEGTDANGQCTVTITSAAAGGSSLTAVYMGTAADDAEIRTYDDTAFKDWVDYELAISADAVNAVGDAHTFTATLNVDTGEGFGPAAGETLQFTFDGVGAVTGGDVDGDLGCTTDDAGNCDIVINSEDGGASTVGVSHDAVVGATSETLTQEAVKQWVDISLVKTAVVGDGFGDGDLVEDPDTGLPTLFFTSSDRGPKTAVFEYLITNIGGDTLFDLTLSDDRLGAIDLPEGLTLEPGESTTVRASEQFTYDDAAGGLNNIIVNVGVVNASGDDGSEVSDTDDAAIQLIAQQSSILIDLQKDVVVGAGDVEAPDGPPTVTWSQSELEAGASKVVRYSFTITNIGPSPIVDVELTDPMISSQPIIAVADGVTLQPGESTVVEVDHVLTADEAFPDGPTAGEVPNVAAVSGANETRDSFDQDSDDAIVFVQVVFAEQEARPLPATGFGSGGLLPLAVLLVTVGAAVLWLDRRRVTGR